MIDLNSDIVGIDFVAGSHGNFLEFVCNTFIAKIGNNFSPFSTHGTSHRKPDDYVSSRKFCANHYSNYGLDIPLNVIRITFTNDDLLVLHTASLLKAANVWLITNELEIDTYHKLNNHHYVEMLHQLTQTYPDVGLSADQPNCPRHVLREFFKFGFRNPADHGLVKKQNEMVYNVQHRVFDFAFSYFYNKQLFLGEMLNLSKWCGVQDLAINKISALHDDFISKQTFKDFKTQADYIITAVQHKASTSINNLDLLQESYINGVLESIYNIEMPFYQTTYFTNTREIIDHLCLK